MTTDDLRLRLSGRRPTDGWRGIGAVVLVFVVATALRMYNLGYPKGLIFDETYYVKQGVSMLKAGVEMKNADATPSPDPMFAKGTTDIYGTVGDFVVHPPIGKWVIGLGELALGPSSSFGWRFSVAVMGSLSVLMIGLLARRLFGSTLLGVVAALLLTFEGHHFVQSRTSLLDMGVMFWTFAAFCAIVADRYRTRDRLPDRFEAALAKDPSVRRRATAFSMGPRPWRLVAAILLGIGLGTKWSAGFYFAGLGLLTVLWDMSAYLALGQRRWVLAGVLRNIWTGIWMTLVVLAVYLLGWTGWIRSDKGWGRDWADTNPAMTGFGWVPDWARSLWHYHVEMYNAARNIRSPHDYMSNPWSWLLQGRPTSFWWQAPKKGADGCTVDSCAQAITSLGTPVLWWFATASVIVLLFVWALRRDWRAGAILLGLAAGYLPWFGYQDRTIFTFYAVVFVPYLVLASTYVLGLIIGPERASVTRRSVGLTIAGSFVALTVACFWFFYPVWTAMTIPYHDWQIRMWFPSWI